MESDDSQPDVDIEQLIRALEDARTEIRAEAIKQLGEIKDARAVPALLRVLNDAPIINDRFSNFDAYYVCVLVLWALGEIGDARAVPDLIRLKSDALRGDADKALEKIDPPSVAALQLRLADRSLDECDRERAMNSLAERGPIGIPAIENILRDYSETELVRWHAVRVLERIGIESLPALMRVLNDPKQESYIRRSAVEGMARIGGIEVLPALEKMVQDTSAEGYIRAYTAAALMWIGPDAVPAMIRILRDPYVDNFVRRSAAWALTSWRQDDPIVLPVLVAMLQDRSMGITIRVRAAENLSHFGPEAISALEQVREDADVDVRDSVARALEQIENRNADGPAGG